MVDSVEQSLPKPSLTSTATRPNTDLSLKVTVSVVAYMVCWASVTVYLL